MNTVTSTQRRDGTCVDDTEGSPPQGTLPTVVDKACRIAAQERYDALAAGGLVGPVDCAKKRDPDRCGTEVVKNAVLFIKEEGDANEVDRADVKQAKLNDCHLMAPLAAIASTPDGRELIKNAITENKNENGEVVSYTVTLHKPEEHWWGPKTFSDVKFTVDARFSAKHADARAAGEAREVWPLVIEKAFAQYRGGYGKIDDNGSPARAMEILTGKPAVDIPLGQGRGYQADRLQCDLAAGKIVVLLTKHTFEGPGAEGLVANHAYQVTGATVEGGKFMVTMHNPWSVDDPSKSHEPPPVPFDELERCFAAIDVGSVR